jgi:tetrahydromethanopterin S-methyltransferase subunit G
MSTANTTNLERISLEAHVDLCAMRYQQLDSRLSNLEEKVDDVHREIVSGQKSMSKVLIGTAGTVIAGILSVVVTVILTMA